MIKYIRNILNLNEKFAYNLIGKLRLLVLPFSNCCLIIQINSIRKRIILRNRSIQERMSSLLPSIKKENIIEILTDEECEFLITKADKILNHEFQILSKRINFSNSIDWHLDFNSGFRWPKGKLYYKYDQVDLNTNADVKFPRELSRCHHFLTLGEAYILTSDEKYTKEFLSEVRSWIKENPYKRSINWGCSMDIAIRASNWIYSLRMFVNSKLIDDDFLLEIFTSLYLHGRFIYENPEKNRVYNHNHYLSDLAGQILLGILFEDVINNEVKQWKENGIYEFFREIRIQILPTGFSYERTTNYHRLVTELISYTIIVLKNNHIEVPQDIMFRIKKMFEAVLYYTFKNGTAPIIGDQDNGRFLPFYSYDINYQKYLINVGAVLFNDGIFRNNSGIHNIDILFLFGYEGVKRFNKIKPELKNLESRSFSDAGFYIMRSDTVFLFINNSGLSHYNEVEGGTHTHSDLLSFVYCYNNVPFLVDPGTYVYSADPKERMKFRSTAMHNTITVDDKDQNDLNENKLWYIKRDAIPREILWYDNKNTSIYEGLHGGFLRLKDPLVHARRFELDKTNDNIRIIDKIKCKRIHQIKCHFHFDKGVEVKISKKEILCKKNGISIKISFDIDSNYDLEMQDEYISKSYNLKVLAPYVMLNTKAQKDFVIITKIKQH